MRKQRHKLIDVVKCPIEATLDIIGGKWKSVILFRLSEQTRRYSELSRLLCKVSPRTLTKQLRELEADGLIRRTVYPQVPPKVEYDLTEKGKTLQPVLAAISEWGQEFVIEAGQEAV
jgi:DNA-binding HxlR family transcriptional regulator